MTQPQRLTLCRAQQQHSLNAHLIRSPEFSLICHLASDLWLHIHIPKECRIAHAVWLCSLCSSSQSNTVASSRTADNPALRMGQTWSSFYSYWFPNKEYKLVLVGLDNAGKTTTLYRLHLGQAVVTHPTVGSNVEQISFRNLEFEVWDLGGQANLRPSWQTYYKATDAVIMVVDSTDRARVGIAKNELFSLLGHEQLAGAAVLVFANKQDLKDAMRPAELSECLGLHTIKTHSYHIQSSCATTGEGLQEGLAWIAQKVHGQFK